MVAQRDLHNMMGLGQVNYFSARLDYRTLDISYGPRAIYIVIPLLDEGSLPPHNEPRSIQLAFAE